MGGHDAHHHEVKVPNYKMYQVEQIPQLVATEKALAAQGLKDPWLRNEVWRYVPNEFGTEKFRINTIVFRGFKIGFAAFLLTVAGTALYEKKYPSEHGHGDHH